MADDDEVRDAPECPVCQKRRLSRRHERNRGMCDKCAAGTGLVVRPPPLRPPAPCPRCRHRQFVRAVLRDRSYSGGDYGGEYVAPLGVSFDTRERRRGAEIVANPDAPIGMLVAHVCRGCGYTEFYTAGFAALPIGPRWGTELVEVDDSAPYR
jgi:hypothetical protein